jgi:hypothetical protein
MSYDLIELTLNRLGEQLPERLSPCLESHQTDRRSARQCAVQRPVGFRLTRQICLSSLPPEPD